MKKLLYSYPLNLSRKKKTVILQQKKNEYSNRRKKLKVTIKRLQFILDIRVQTKIMIRTKRTYPLPLPFQFPVTVFLIAEKLLRA